MRRQIFFSKVKQTEELFPSIRSHVRVGGDTQRNLVPKKKLMLLILNVNTTFVLSELLSCKKSFLKLREIL